MNEEGRTHVRYMACVYAKEIMLHASDLIIEEGRENPNQKRAMEFTDNIEAALKKLRVNLSEPLSKPTEATPDR